MHDGRARTILFRMFWKNGWIPEASRTVSPDDFAYAKRMAYMFEPVALSHDALLSRLAGACRQADLAALSASFLASLGNRRLDLRSALGSYAFAANLPPHLIDVTPVTLLPSGGRQCDWCGIYEFEQPRPIDLNLLNFERHKWGGVRHDSPAYAWLDLSLFAREALGDVTGADRDTMRTILRIAGSMDPAATAGHLEKALTGAFPSSKDERRVLIEILAVCGVLQPKGRSGYFGEFTLASERAHTGQHFNDWGYPARWWRGSDGVNEAALARYFPGL